MNASKRAADRKEPHHSACLYCLGDELKTRFASVTDRLGHVDGTWDFSECGSCASLNLRPLPLPEETASFYPEAYTFDASLGKKAGKQILAAIEKHFFFKRIASWEADLVLRITGNTGRGRKLRVVDIGCGPGLRLAALRDRGISVLGVDFSPSVVEKLKLEHGMEGIVSDVASLPEKLAPESADIITAFDVAEHLPDLDQSIEACLTLLKPGGWLVIGTPMSDCYQAALFGKRWSAIGEAPRHVSIPSQKGMRRFLERFGLAQVSMHPYAVQDCSLIIAASLFPTASTRFVYGAGSNWKSSLLRYAAGLTALLTAPCCLIENYVAGRPSRAIYFARKP